MELLDPRWRMQRCACCGQIRMILVQQEDNPLDLCSECLTRSGKP